MSVLAVPEELRLDSGAKAAVLCVVDQRSLDGDALGVAVQMARRYGTSVHLVSVVPTLCAVPRLPRSGRVATVEVSSRRSEVDVGSRAATTMLAHATAVIPAEMPVTGEVHSGDPVGAIVEAIRSVRPMVAVLSADPGGAGAEGTRQVLAAAASAGSAVVVA